VIFLVSWGFGPAGIWAETIYRVSDRRWGREIYRTFYNFEYRYLLLFRNFNNSPLSQGLRDFVVLQPGVWDEREPRMVGAVTTPSLYYRVRRRVIQFTYLSESISVPDFELIMMGKTHNRSHQPLKLHYPEQRELATSASRRCSREPCSLRHLNLASLS